MYSLCTVFLSHTFSMNQIQIINLCLAFALTNVHFRGMLTSFLTFSSKQSGLDQSEIGNP